MSNGFDFNKGPFMKESGTFFAWRRAGNLYIRTNKLSIIAKKNFSYRYE